MNNQKKEAQNLNKGNIKMKLVLNMVMNCEPCLIEKVQSMMLNSPKMYHPIMNVVGSTLAIAFQMNEEDKCAITNFSISPVADEDPKKSADQEENTEKVIAE